MKIIFTSASILFLALVCSAQIDTLNDEFNRTCHLSQWQNVNLTEGWNASHLEAHDINLTNEGHLTMMPWTTGWFQDRRSTLLYKEASGDFIFTTYVMATNRAEDDIPGSDYSLAGAMIRTPKTIQNGLGDWVAGEENYVFLSLGYAATNHPSCSGCPGPHFEVKSTTNSNSNLNIVSIDTAAAIIRLVKIQDAIVVLYQLPGGNFTIRQRYSRSDMPDTLQVGLVTYTDWNKVFTYTQTFLNSHTINDDLDPDPSSDPLLPFDPDLIGQFDYARFEEVNLPVAYQGFDFSDPAEVSDAEIISLFSYASVSTDLLGWKIWQGTDSDWTNPNNWSGNTLPTSMDSILIPDCGCDAVQFPIAPVGSNTFASLVIEEGGQLTIPVTSSFFIDLSGSNAQFLIDGSIYNNGLMEVNHMLGKNVSTSGIINCNPNAVCNFIE